jgi:hypothetical protein
MLQCLQALTNGGESAGLLFSDDPAEIEKFKALHDHPGCGVYRCVNPLKPGSRRRVIQNVEQVERIVVDVDFKTIAETRDEVYARLIGLDLEPTQAVMSGGGWHLKWELKEPIEADDVEGMAKATSRYHTTPENWQAVP